MITKHKQLIIGIFSFITASFFLCYEMGLQVALAVVTHPLMQDFGLDAAKLGWLTACYFLAYTLMQIPAGLLFDRFSCRTVLTLSALSCSLGALLFVKTSYVPLIYLSRFLIGAGSAFPFVGVLVVASKCFRKDLFAIFVGITQLLAAMGAFLGSAPLSALVVKIGWQDAMFYCAITGFIIVGLSWLGIAALKPEQQDKPLEIKQSISKVIKNKQTWLIALYAFSNWGPVIILTSLWGDPFLVEKMHITTTNAALVVEMIWLGIALGSLTVGYLSEHFKTRKPFMAICGLLGVASSIFIIYGHIESLLILSSLFFICGIAAAGQILSFAMVRELQPENIVGTAIGFNNMAVVAGGFLLQPLIGELMQLFWHGKYLNDVPHYQLITFQKALIMVPICFIICVITTYFLGKSKSS